MNTVAKTAAIPFLKKITPRSVTDALKFDLLNQNRPVPAKHLYDLFGVINGYKQKADEKSEKGVWTQFKGQFRAVTPPDADGVVQMFESGATHIPVLEDMILSTFQTAKATDDRAQIHVALRVSIVPAAPGKPSMTGYEYDVQRLLPAEDTAEDPIVRLMQAAAKANPPQLAGPAAGAPAPAPTPAPTPTQEMAGTAGKTQHHKAK